MSNGLSKFNLFFFSLSVVTIGPDPLNINVNESMGVVEVCIVAEDGFDEDCPVGFPFNLTLQISEGLGS